MRVRPLEHVGHDDDGDDEHQVPHHDEQHREEPDADVGEEGAGRGRLDPLEGVVVVVPYEEGVGAPEDDGAQHAQHHHDDARDHLAQQHLARRALQVLPDDVVRLGCGVHGEPAAEDAQVPRHVLGLEGLLDGLRGHELVEGDEGIARAPVAGAHQPLDVLVVLLEPRQRLDHRSARPAHLGHVRLGLPFGPGRAPAPPLLVGQHLHEVEQQVVVPVLERARGVDRLDQLAVVERQPHVHHVAEALLEKLTHARAAPARRHVAHHDSEVGRSELPLLAAAPHAVVDRLHLAWVGGRVRVRVVGLWGWG